MSENWAKLEGQLVNGVFPLRSLLGVSGHSAVFLTEHRPKNISSAAIKLMKADPAGIQTRLPFWRRGATLRHPNLVQLLDVGRCRLGSDVYDFVVMEFAEQTLGQILPRRALTAAEVQELLPCVRDALSYLHQQNLAHGSVQPSNILVVNDTVKLSSDNIRPGADAGEDLRGLGMTLVEALTQRHAAWTDERRESASLPPGLPEDLAQSIQGLLRRSSTPIVPGVPKSQDPRTTTVAPGAPVTTEPTPAAAAAKPAAAKQQAPAAQAEPASLPVAPRSPPRTGPTWAEPTAAATPQELMTPEPRSVLVPVAMGVLVLAAIWGGVRILRNHAHGGSTAVEAPAPSIPAAATTAPDALEPANSTAAPVLQPGPPPSPPSQAPAATSASSAPPSGLAASAAPSAGSPVVHQDIPDIPAHIRTNIRGHIRVSIRVTVDHAGIVTGSSVENGGPSHYFARKAAESARKWTFAPADKPARRWVIVFEFTRDGTSATASAR